MISDTEIVSFHGRLALALKEEELIGQPIKILPDDESWRNKTFQAEAAFQARPAQPSQRAEYARSDFQHKVYVFSLLRKAQRLPLTEVRFEDRKSYGWVSWYEKWQKLPTDEFTLIVAKWMLFWGRQGDPIKAQVVRAEWDHTAFLNGKPDNAGQPHWHVDRHLELNTTTPPRPTLGGALQGIEGSSDTSLRDKGQSQPQLPRLNVHKVHLAMGGWKHFDLPEVSQGNANPQAKSKRKAAEREVRKAEKDDSTRRIVDPLAPAWQFKCADNTEELSQWSIRTLRYLKSQAQYLHEL